MRRYKIKEIFFTLQGEGAQTGKAAVFCRFTGCNLWSGKEEDRSKAACRFCDTDFRGMDGSEGGLYTANELALKILELWPRQNNAMVVFTGGEPLLQLDHFLIAACKSKGISVAIETNGTQVIPKGIDWISISPKPRSARTATTGTELKLVYPQPEAEMNPAKFENYDVEHFFLQPMDGPNIKENTARAIQYCRRNPKWQLSLQTQKMLGLR